MTTSNQILMAALLVALWFSGFVLGLSVGNECSTASAAFTTPGNVTIPFDPHDLYIGTYRSNEYGTWEWDGSAWQPRVTYGDATPPTEPPWNRGGWVEYGDNGDVTIVEGDPTP